VSYLGWEQEFFVVTKEAYLARPDLRACGRTLMGAPPTRGQQADLNYFAAMPPTVKACMDEVQTELLKIGCPLNVYHNEVAPAQHEISPFFTITNISADLNQISMQMCVDIGAKHGLVFLFHEKPFAGINGSGKHNNWSIGTDSGLNFFSPGKTQESSELFTIALACLTYAVNQHNTVIRNAVAHAGNDHRLGAQEAPPAIISLYPGTTFDAKVKEIVAGGALAGYFSGGELLDTKCANLNDIERGLEDRNRTAPFPFCGNRFEFRAVGSSQDCSFPMALVDTAFADGMRALSELIEAGSSVRDACAAIFEQNQRVIFVGNGYSPEWPIEAEKRGLPNLKDAVSAHAEFATPENKALFERMGVMTPQEVDARAEVMFENYCTVLEVEATTLVSMVRTGVEPACQKDLNTYVTNTKHKRYTVRAAAYDAIGDECDKLEEAIKGMPAEGVVVIATYCRDTIKPLLGSVREACDTAEGLVESELWPFMSYTDVCFGHHLSSPKC